MKYFFAVWATLLLLGSCAKAKEDVIEQTALNMLNATEWKIVGFTQGT